MYHRCITDVSSPRNLTKGVGINRALTPTLKTIMSILTQIEELRKKILELQKKLLELIAHQKKPQFIIIHHEGADNGFESVNEYHKQKWHFKSSLGYFIGYQYYIDKQGKIYQGRADNEEGAHAIGYNKNSVGICLQGNFMLTNPTNEQKASLIALVSRLMTSYDISKEKIKGHRDVSNTLCPGDNLYNYIKGRYQ